MHDNFVSLIGYRGTGKSTVARRVAQCLNWQFVDADDEIVRHAGQSIKGIFAAGGESTFRDWESRVVDDLTQRTHVVVAWGGGVILRDANRRALRRGCVVWLTADPRTILGRVTADATTADRRPNLTTTGGLSEIEQLLRVREPLYRECADHTVATVGKTAEQVADEIVCFLQTRPTS